MKTGLQCEVFTWHDLAIYEAKMCVNRVFCSLKVMLSRVLLKTQKQPLTVRKNRI
jgi:hypothetical protein